MGTCTGAIKAGLPFAAEGKGAGGEEEEEEAARGTPSSSGLFPLFLCKNNKRGFTKVLVIRTVVPSGICTTSLPHGSPLSCITQWWRCVSELHPGTKRRAEHGRQTSDDMRA